MSVRNTDRLVRYSEASQIVGLAISSIKRLEGIGAFPKRVQISPRAVGYRLSDLEEFVREREYAIEFSQPSNMEVN